MSEIKALQELRKSFEDCTSKAGAEGAEFDAVWIVGNAALAMLDRLESEIAERFMELPVDAEGEPWHIGDVTENGNRVNAITFDRFGAHFSGTVNDVDPSIHVHFKPRTLEDVLRDVVTLCANTWKDEKSAFRYYDVDNVMDSGNIADFAAEIRELLGGAE